MKYLENASLEYLSNFLCQREMGGCILEGRVEAFSCKRAGDDKKLSKALEAKFVDDIASSPPSRIRSTSLGDLNEGSTRRLLIDLISTLNASFPDYDFSALSPEAFRHVDFSQMVQRVNSSLAELTTTNPTFLEDMWRTIDEIIQVKDCEVYTYIPDMDEDPFSDGALWSFNYFLFNKELKRICYFTCLAKSALYYDRQDDDMGDDEDAGDSMMFSYDSGDEDDDDDMNIS